LDSEDATAFSERRPQSLPFGRERLGDRCQERARKLRLPTAPGTNLRSSLRRSNIRALELTLDHVTAIAEFTGRPPRPVWPQPRRAGANGRLAARERGSQHRALRDCRSGCQGV